MSLFTRLFSGRVDRRELRPLYDAIVGRARDPLWYRDGAVPDTLDGRFDMVAAVFTLVTLRLEAEGDAGRLPSTILTEIFIDDMDGQLREAGMGDVVVGKHIGRMMSALGGRIAAYRAGLAPAGDLEQALVRNLYRGEAPERQALLFTSDRLRALRASLARVPLKVLLGGDLPAA